MLQDKIMKYKAMFCMERMPGNSMTHGHSTTQTLSLTELLWFISFTCNPICSVRILRTWNHTYISLSALNFTLVGKWLYWGVEKEGINITATQTTEDWIRGTLCYTVTVTSLNCLVSSSSVLLFPNPNSHFFLMRYGLATLQLLSHLLSEMTYQDTALNKNRPFSMRDSSAT